MMSADHLMGFLYLIFFEAFAWIGGVLFIIGFSLVFVRVISQFK